MARYTLEDGQYEEDWSNKIEPWTAGLGLTADAVGLGTAATGIGAPIGGTIALIGNIPNFIVDAYQMGRDWYRYYNDGGGGNLKDALWNTGETALDVIGGKLISKGLKRVNDKTFVKELNGRIQDEIKKREGQRFMLRKKGMTNEQILEYITQKATAAAVNSKDIIDAKKRMKEKQINQEIMIGNILSGIQNGHNVIAALPNDATRVNRPIYIPQPIQLR